MNAKVSFQSELANVWYGTPASPEREPEEVAIVERLRSLLSTSGSKEIFGVAPLIDAMVMPVLSGRNALAVAKMIEVRAPMAIPSMPRLHAMQSELSRVAELDGILRGLPRMIEALKAESKKEEDAK